MGKSMKFVKHKLSHLHIGRIHRTNSGYTYIKGGGYTMAYDFGLRLRTSRKNKKLSQREASKRLGISRTMISSYENNICMPSVDRLVQMAVLYNVSTDYLLNISPKAENPEDAYFNLKELLDNLEKPLSEVVATVNEMKRNL